MEKSSQELAISVVPIYFIIIILITREGEVLTNLSFS